MQSILSIPVGSPISNGTQTVDTDITINGDLFVNGYLTALSGNILIDIQTADKSVTLNTPCSGAGVPGDGIAGLFIDRGTLPEVSIVFNENTDAVEVHYEGSADQTVMLRSTSPLSGAIPFGNTSLGYTHDDSNLHWDDANNRLGIGTNTPANTLDVVGIASATTVSVGKTTNSGYAVDVKASATNPTLTLSLDGYPTTSASSALRMRSRTAAGAEMKNDISSNSANGGTFNISDNADVNRISFNPNRLYGNFKKTGDQSLFDLYDGTLVSGEFVRRRLGSGNSGGGAGASLTETFYYSTTPTSSRGTYFIEGYENKGLQINSIGLGIGVTPETQLHITDAVGDVAIRLQGRNGAGAKTQLNSNNGYGFLGTTDTSPMVIASNSTVAITVISGGNVGIGNTNPLQKLDVGGSISLGYRDQSALTRYIGLPGNTGVFSDVETAGTAGMIIKQSAAGDVDLHFKNGMWGVQETIKMSISGNGYIGINNTAPKSLLHIKQTQDDNHAGAVKITRFDTGTDTFNIQVGQGNNLHFGYSATTTGTPDISAQMQLSSTGNLGIGGTASATNKLKVNGNMETNGVVFPATQVPSADLNTIDDYREGNVGTSFTPALEFASGQTGTFTLTQQVGTYTRIGDLVHYTVIIQWSAKPSAGTQFRLTGLPFTSRSVGQSTSGTIYGEASSGSWTGSSPTIFGVNPNSTNGAFWRQTTTNSASYDVGDIPTNGRLIFSGMYKAA